MEQRTQAEIDHRTLEWAAGLFDDWLATNEEAQEIQRHLPPHLTAEVVALPPGLHGSAASLAFQASPETLSTSHAVLSSARQVIGRMMDGSVSHPPLRVEPTTSDETTRAEVGDGLEVRVCALEERLERLERLTEEVSSLAAELRSLLEVRRAG